MPRILLVTGEASGDLHGANLARELKALCPDVDLVGVGGAKMHAAGVSLIPGIRRLDMVGLPGPAQLLTAAYNYRAITRFLAEATLNAVVFIDHPGLNLRLAKAAKQTGHRVVYYIAPQVWAWHPARMQQLSRFVDRLLVILPFEETLFRQAGIACEFVGHPLLDAVASTYDRVALRRRYGVADDAMILGLLPGSREREVRALLQPMLRAAAQLDSLHPGIRPIVAQASSIRDELIEELSDRSGLKPQILKDLPNEVMAMSDLLLVASGTATLQAAVVGTPLVIAYRASWLTYWVARCLIKIDCIGLVNIVAGQRIVPEVIQHDVTPERLAAEASRLLRDRAAFGRMREALHKVRDSLGTPGASKRAATVILRECRA
jgi:lipid-A-disaccharide synthase